jgi:FG-GAP-like repeat/PQQ-like domain
MADERHDQVEFGDSAGARRLERAAELIDRPYAAARRMGMIDASRSQEASMTSLASHARIRALRATASIVAALLGVPAAHAYDWLQFNGDAAHAGNNRLEHTLGPANASTLTLKFTATLPSAADGAPVALRGVPLAAGPADLLFVTTRGGDLVAVNAATGAIVWSKPHGPGTCVINGSASNGTCYTTSSPAIDPGRQYVYSYGLDGYVHKHGVTDGTEVTSGGWPQLATLKAYNEKGSSALAFAETGDGAFLYVTHGGYPGDRDDYQGHVTAINLANGAQNVFNAMCSDVRAHLGVIPSNPSNPPSDPYCTTPRSAIWARPGVIYDASLDRLFVATGNGTYTGNSDGLFWSESILALNPDATSIATTPVDAYTPTNFQSLDNADADLGSTTIAIVPAPAGSKYAHFAVQGGKDAKLRFVNLANLSNGATAGPGQVGGEFGSISTPQGGGVFAQPAVWIRPTDDARWVYVSTGSGVAGLRVNVDGSGNPSLASQWTTPGNAASPLLAHNVLYYAGSNGLHALDPVTGNPLWSSTAGQVGDIHWQSPLVFNGMLYVTDQSSHLVAYAPTTAHASIGLDVDADRKADLAWRSSSGQTSLWEMNGTSASSKATIFTDANWSVIGTADFSGDTRDDLVWKNASSGATALWLMNGLNSTATAVVWPDGSWTPTQFGDFDGDGHSDIVWRNSTTGATAIWLMNGLSSTGAAVVFSDPHWSVIFTADMDGDGRSDLVWQNSSTGQSAVWLMDGLKGSLADYVSSGNAHIVAVGDFDGDGRADLVWHDDATGRTSIALMNGTTTQDERTIFTDKSWLVIGTADFNGDGHDDLLWRNSATGAVAVWLMNGFTTLDARVLFTDPQWIPVAEGDTNGDGKADILWRNSQSGATALWLMNGAASSAAQTLNADSSLSLVVPLH